jgi:outer membrane protein
MRIFRLFAATMFIAALAAALPAFAQQRGGTSATTPPAASPAATQATGPVPSSKIAFVNTQAFGSEKTGITRYIAAIRNLEREFKPRQDELNSIATRVKAIADEIQKTETVADPTVIQRKREEGEKLQREYKFKKEEAEATFQSRYEQVVGPVSNDIGKALDAFAKQRGITMILDLSKQAILESVLTLDPSMDVTAAFIAEYNSKNPATASTAAPGR